jgi:hypothetical protein
MSPANQHAETANPYALSAILGASASKNIIASEDIVDENGVKLWGKNQPVSYALQQRLLERKLRQPLEACLRAQDGVTVLDVFARAQAIVDGDSSFARAIQPWAKEVLDDVRQLPIHPAIQLLLTAAQDAAPHTFDHAIGSMLLAGAMSAFSQGSHFQNRLAMLGGLLHDLGELYVNPDYLDPSTAMTPQAYRHLVVHPRTGELLIAKLTDYPASLYRAVGEHHERCDGSGYPMGADGKKLSPEGCRLSAVETIMGITSTDPVCLWTRVSLAMRLVPGEFDAATTSFASQIARHANESPEPADDVDKHAVLQGNDLIRERIGSALKLALGLVNRSSSPLVRRIAARTVQMLQQLTLACNALGTWAPRTLIGEDIFELSFANKEFSYRIEAIRRAASWSEPTVQPSDEEELTDLWACLLPTNQQQS